MVTKNDTSFSRIGTVGREYNSLNKSGIALREEYIKKRIVTKKYLDDALHVATATVFCCDIMVSWNFRHIVHIAIWEVIEK